ncbi:hypothetical protein AAHA92_10882 [Salvia divinorum]|uniref:Uncharacterized protein n=1 Tax=Salvia divinorum TaxID=28513 RepID=A0ABD1HXW9_SALDI
MYRLRWRIVLILLHLDIN